MRSLEKFMLSEDGAVTVDFVVLTSAVVGLGLATLLVIAPNLGPVASGIDPAMADAPGLGAGLVSD